MYLLNRLKKSTPEQEEKFRKELEEEHLRITWKDKLAMIISAYAVLVLPAILILVLMCAAALGLLGIL